MRGYWLRSSRVIGGAAAGDVGDDAAVAVVVDDELRPLLPRQLQRPQSQSRHGVVVASVVVVVAVGVAGAEVVGLDGGALPAYGLVRSRRQRRHLRP